MPVITTGLLMLQYAAQLAIWPIEEPLQDIVRRNVVDLDGLATEQQRSQQYESKDREKSKPYHLKISRNMRGSFMTQ